MGTEIIKGKWALVTGVSSGFGVNFVRELADTSVKCSVISPRPVITEFQEVAR